MLQRGERAEWQRWPMTVEPGQPGHRYMVLDVSARSEYFVEANGVRSDLFRLDVVDVPYVARIDLEYRFPEYTGLAPQPVEDAGDVAALRGTRVELRVTTTVPVPSGRLVVEGEAPRPLEPVADGTLGGSFEVTRDAFYRIELPSSDGRLQSGSPDYAIDVLDDQPPLVRMLKPGRDAQVTSIEEVFTEVEAEDDFGVAKLELVYSIGGAPEKTLPLHGGRPRKQLSAGHTFFLEEHALEPGDFISYFARATDNRGAPARQQSTTDIYFMEVRPFDRAYRQAAEGRRRGMAGGGDGDTLSRQQRQIVAATFKLRRDRGRSEPRQLEQDVATLALVQGRLRDQVANLNRRMLNRGVAGTGSKLGDTAESLQQAVVEMGAAVTELEARRLDSALAPEQRALQHLQRAEAAFRDVQVAFGQGGGGGGGAASPDELSDLFELELDKLENQYEAVQRGQSQQLDQAVDEAMQRLRELARRQEQEVERQRRSTSGSPGGQGAAGSGQQRRLAERGGRAGPPPRAPRPRAVDARTAGNGESPEAGGRLHAPRRRRRRERGARAGSFRSRPPQGRAADARAEPRGAHPAGHRARGRRRRGDRPRPGPDRRRGTPIGQRPGSGRGARAASRRAQGRAGGTGAGRSSSSSTAWPATPEASAATASRALSEAARGIRENKLKEKIRYSKGVVRGRPGEAAQQFEAEIGKDVDQLSRQVTDAAQALSEAKGDSRSAALERTRDLVRRMESIQERLKQGPAAGEAGSSQGSASASRGEAGGGVAARLGRLAPASARVPPASRGRSRDRHPARGGRRHTGRPA